MKKIIVFSIIFLSIAIGGILYAFQDTPPPSPAVEQGAFCTAGEDSNNTGGCAIDGAEQGTQVVDTGKIAPDFTLQTVSGDDLTLSQLLQQKPVILDFWTSWCPNCRRDMPKLDALYEQYADQVEVVGVNLKESSSTVQEYVDSANISYPIVLDTNGAVARSYGVSYTNTHILINRQGMIVRVIPGDISEADILSLIQ